MSAEGVSLAEEVTRLMWLESAIEERPWRVTFGKQGNPLEGRSPHGQVFYCWGRDEEEGLRTFEFVTLCRNLLPEVMAGMSAIVTAAEAVVASERSAGQLDGQALSPELVALGEALAGWRSAVVPEVAIHPPFLRSDGTPSWRKFETVIPPGVDGSWPPVAEQAARVPSIFPDSNSPH